MERDRRATYSPPRPDSGDTRIVLISVLMFPRKLIVLVAVSVCLGGCSTINSQISGRTATEQYLVTASIGRAIKGVNWNRLSDQRVCTEVVGVQATEYEYIATALEKALLEAKAIPVEDSAMADVKMTVVLHSAGTDIWLSNFGIPFFLSFNASVPSNMAGISLYNSNLQEGYCRMQFYGTDPHTGKLAWQSDTVKGTSYFKTQTYLGIFGPYKSGDIYPEKKLFRPKGYKPEE